MHSIQHEQYKMSLNYHHLAKCSFSSFKLAKFYFSIKKKNWGFWDPHNFSKKPQMPFLIFNTFIRISFLFPFILYSSQHFIGVILLIFFDVFKNLAPKWPLFLGFLQLALSQKPLAIFQSPFAHARDFCSYTFSFFLLFLSNDVLIPKWSFFCLF